VNLFEVVGIVLGLWALTVTFLGLRTENFPATDRAMRITIAISVTLVVLAIGSAIYVGATEKRGGDTGKTSALLPL
jgi:uncharacterized membrane protein YczE